MIGSQMVLTKKRVFNLQGGKIKEGPLLYQLEYSIRRVLLGPDI